MVNKKEFNASKQPIDLNLVDRNKIVRSDKFKHTDDGFKYFIGYKEDIIVSGYIKYFENRKMCLFSLKIIAYWLNIMKFEKESKWPWA